ncbi:MAG TPA: TolC family protein [Gemmatimonadales bacterium]|nr:TolC family protein [Gemmatimonadales bacterium]
MNRMTPVFFMVAAFAGRAAAQAPADTIRMTLADAINRAQEQAVDVRIARADVRDANGQVRQAFSGALPQVTGTFLYTRQFASIYSGLGGANDSLANLFKDTPFGAPNNWNFQLQATQLLWSGGKLGARLKAAKSFREAASNRQVETESDVTLAVTRAYWEAALEKRMLAIAVDNLEQAQDHLHQVSLYRQAGTRAEYDLLRAQVDAANQEPLVVQARNQLDVAVLDLKRLLNIPAEQPLALATALESSDEMIPVPTVDSLENPARPGLAAADATVREQEQLLKVARSDYWPTLSLTTTYTQQAFPLGVSPFGAQYHEGWNGEVRITIPIFNGFRTGGQVDQARANLERAQAQRDGLKQQINLEVARAWGELERARSLLAARQQTVRQAQRAQYLAGVRYTNGMATQLDVSDARVSAAQAEVNQVQATRDYLVALAELERALGRPLPVERQPIEHVAVIPNQKEANP